MKNYPRKSSYKSWNPDKKLAYGKDLKCIYQHLVEARDLMDKCNMVAHAQQLEKVIDAFRFDEFAKVAVRYYNHNKDNNVAEPQIISPDNLPF